MKVLIKDELKDIVVTTITLATDPKDKQGLWINPFFCFRCQKFLCKFQGHVVSIMPGLDPTPLPVILSCVNPRHEFETEANPKGICGMNYRFVALL